MSVCMSQKYVEFETSMNYFLLRKLAETFLVNTQLQSVLHSTILTFYETIPHNNMQSHGFTPEVAQPVDSTNSCCSQLNFFLPSWVRLQILIRPPPQSHWRPKKEGSVSLTFIMIKVKPMYPYNTLPLTHSRPPLPIYTQSHTVSHHTECNLRKEAHEPSTDVKSN